MEASPESKPRTSLAGALLRVAAMFVMLFAIPLVLISLVSLARLLTWRSPSDATLGLFLVPLGPVGVLTGWGLHRLSRRFR